MRSSATEHDDPAPQSDPSGLPRAPGLRGEARLTQPIFSQPVRQILMMLVVLALVGAGIWLAFARIFPIFQANLALNGVILGVFILGVLGCFWQVIQLTRCVRWIEGFARDPATGAGGPVPPMLAPMAALLSGRNRRMAISSSAARSILESVASRIDEARDITRYLASLLIFLGLLGTFYGLATTVPAVVDTIRALAPESGESGIAVFDKLMSGLEAQLGGMGTAFSSSLLGLAGSLIVGLLELFASHGQNRFYGELEEWMSGFTRLGLAGDGTEAVDQATIVAVLDQMAGQMEALEDFYAHAEVGRSTLESRLLGMTQALDRLGDRIESGLGSGLSRLAEAGADTPARLSALTEAAHARHAVLERLAAGQDRLLALQEAAQEEGAQPETRARLRSIDLQLLRLCEDLAESRLDLTEDLRRDIRELTAALDGLTAAAVESAPAAGQG